MIKKVGVIALVGGVVVLLGNYITALQNYYLVPIGAGLAILAAIVDNFSNR